MTLKNKAGLIAAVALFGMPGASVQAATPSPDLSGYWMPEKPSERLLTIDGKTPPLKPQPLAQYHKNRAAKAKNDLSFDDAARCVSPGIPRLLNMPYPFEIVQSSRYMAMLFAWNRIFRIVELDKEAPPADYPYKIGVASGHWQGDELKVRTQDIAAETLLDDEGMPHSDAMIVREAYSLSVDGNTLINLVTVEDAKTFTRPWQARITYRRLPSNYILPEDICLDRTDAGRPAIERIPG